jgi:survival-of-motor-neuron-related-splicing factor 30
MGLVLDVFTVMLVYNHFFCWHPSAAVVKPVLESALKAWTPKHWTGVTRLAHFTHLHLLLSSDLAMDKELETYQVQLEQVELALKGDPDNTELSSLQSERQELIALTQQSLATSASSSASGSKPRAPAAAGVAPAATKTWAAGDECLAKYSADGHWYSARIISVGGGADKRLYTVIFKGYESTEVVQDGALKPLPAGGGGGGFVAGSKRKLSKAEEDEREKKKKKNEKKLEVRATKAKEQVAKQATWQKFAKKSEKKGIHIAGTSGTSIFKTPENPMGKGACPQFCITRGDGSPTLQSA